MMENRKPRLFRLNRLKDSKKISGIGKVIDGVVFRDGTVVIQWQTKRPSIGVYKDMEDFILIHAKPYFGDNEFEWVEGYSPSQELSHILDEAIDFVFRQSDGIKDNAKGNIVAKLTAIKNSQLKAKDPMKLGSPNRLDKKL